MKRVLLFLSLLVPALQGFADLNGDGFYRVQNVKQSRYISVIDNRGSINISTTDADMEALRTVYGFERVVSDPSSIIYFKKMDSGYDFQSQGTGSYSIIGYQVQISGASGKYYCYASAGAGVTKYLSDALIPNAYMEDPEFWINEIIYGTVVTNSQSTRQWYIKPVDAAGDCYFGITPTVAAGGSFYQSFFAAFPFTFSSTGMKAYTVTTVDSHKAAVVLTEVTGGVPTSTPVIIKCSSDQPVNNKLNVGATVTGSANGNLLNGVYFCNDVVNEKHRNVKNYDPATMRVLGTAADGSLAFVKSETLKYIPANTAYILVPAGSPDELKVYSQAEYDELPDAPKTIDITVNSYTRKYGEANPEFTYTVSSQDVDLTGMLTVVCEANEQSGVGEYPITVECSSTDYDITCIPGTLTITPASLSVTAQNAERLYGSANPTLSYSVNGFVNNETEAVFSEKPVVATEATPTSPAGTYNITVFGGQAANYIITSYHGATLTVNKVPLTVQANDATRTYGAENPAFTYSISGFVNNETEAVLSTKPSVHSSATASSAVGNYVIWASGAVADNYTFNYYEGQLTVTKAPLKATVKDATCTYGSTPDYEIEYYGFVNGETQSVLTSAPTVTSTASAGSPVGEYVTTLSGGYAANYEFKEYVDGKLTITKAPLKVTADDVTWVTDTEWPTFGVTYEGFVLNETESVLTKKPVAETTATKDSAEGTYTITVSGGEATNYTFEYVAGTLTIKKSGDVAVGSMKNSKAVSAVYDLRGRKVADAATLDELPKGVYIIGGRKVVK